MIITDNFKPFFGVVEDLLDPEKLGRIRVRCYGYHTEEKSFIPTETLRWFSVLIPNSAGTSGIGMSPTGYVTGSTVFGYFLSNDLQDGIILGSLTGKPTEKAFTNLGFNDPNGTYPIFINESDVNRLARNENIEETIVKTKTDGVRTDVESFSSSWDEPLTPYDADYPYNMVSESVSGHIHEIDDTPGRERIHEYHRTGTFREIHPDGSAVIKVVGDNYTIIAGDGYFCVEGNATGFVGGNNDLVIKGNNSVRINGNNTIVIDKNNDIHIKENNNIDIDGSNNVTIAGTSTTDVEGNTILRAPKIQLGEDAKVEPSVLGDKLSNWINFELIPWLDAHTHIGNLGFPTSPAATSITGPMPPGTAAPQGAVYSKLNKNQ